jgi:hypothetical protein
MRGKNTAKFKKEIFSRTSRPISFKVDANHT